MSFILYPVFSIFFATTMLIFDALQRVGLLFGEESQAKVVNWENAAILKCLSLFAGVKFSIKYTEEISCNGPLIIVSNHQSMFDIPIISEIFPEKLVGFVAKRELAKWVPGTSIYLRSSYNGLIDRKDPQQAIEEIGRVGKSIIGTNRGITLFPEGTRSKDGEVAKFRSIGFTTLSKACPEARVLPIAIKNSYHLGKWPKFPITFGTSIEITVGPLLDAPGEVSHKQTLNLCREWIVDKLADCNS